MDLLSLIPSFGGVLFTLAAFFVALLIIVFVHEYGHYIVGRWTGIKAEVFSIGFGPVLWSRPDKHGTRWQIAAIPLGGYVKFLGDGDAASVSRGADVPASEARASVHSAPLWARSATVAAGPLFNFALSIIVFAGLVMVRGVATDPLTVADLPPTPYVQNLAIGDQIVGIEGQETPALEEFGLFANELPVQSFVKYDVLRDGQLRELDALHPYPAFVASVSPESAASDAGLRVGDFIMAVGDQQMDAFSELQAVVAAAEGETVSLTIWRDGTEFVQELTPRRTDLPLPDGGFETRWLIGISGGLWFVPATEALGPWEGLKFGVNQTIFIVRSSLSGLYHMITGAISSCNLRGPIGIAQTSGTIAAQGLTSFIGFIALLSTAVGLLNLFPVPVLDGGHLVFHAYEAITGKPPSDGALRWIMSVGLALIGTLMIFALYNDLFC